MRTETTAAQRESAAALPAGGCKMVGELHACGMDGRMMDAQFWGQIPEKWPGCDLRHT
jgi:hypothetical protein